MGLLSSIIGGATSLIGGALGGSKDRKLAGATALMEQDMFQQNFDQQQSFFDRNMAFARGEAGRDQRNYMRNFKANRADERWERQWAQKQMDQQNRFAKKSAGWAFDDLMQSADEAGIHRLAALGAGGGAGYQPVSSGGGAPMPQSTQGGAPAPGSPSMIPDLTPIESAWVGDAVGDGIAMVLRGIEQQHERKLDAKEIELMDAEIELLRSQSRTFNQSARNAGYSGSTKDAIVNDKDKHIEREMGNWQKVFTRWGEHQRPRGDDGGEVGISALDELIAFNHWFMKEYHKGLGKIGKKGAQALGDYFKNHQDPEVRWSPWTGNL